MILVLIIFSVILILFSIYLYTRIKRISTQKNILQQRFDNLQRLSHTGYFDGYFNDDNVWWSEELNKLIGLKPHEYITKKDDAISLIYEEDRGGYLQLLEKTIEDGSSLATEYRGKNVRTGEIRHYRTNVEVIKDSEGKPIGLRGTVQDNTDKKEIQLALSESEVKQANVMSNIDDLVFVLDNEGIFRDFYNSSSSDRLYTSPDRFLNKHYKEVLPISINTQFDSILELIRKDGKSRQFDYSLEINGELKCKSKCIQR